MIGREQNEYMFGPKSADGPRVGSYIPCPKTKYSSVT